ncbi:MAG: 2OG-Fe(II) oxygenase [Hyphomicrobiaceae bacterium]|nr:2OG-Fe(II) oxygenase [Hyphomicrobiaceae bacterium]
MNAMPAPKLEPVDGEAVVQSFLSCLQRARHETKPFDFWLLEDALPIEDANGIVALPFAPPAEILFNGKRETNNATRVYFTPENQARFPVCARVAAGFDDPRVRRTIEESTGTDLTGTRLRIEYCQDTPGFWLEPHTDIFVKKFTMLVYLSDDPGLKLAGTDIHEGPPDFRYVCSAPYGMNKGVIFIPGKTSWHGVGHHPVTGTRRSIIINFVTADWRDTWELC